VQTTSSDASFPLPAQTGYNHDGRPSTAMMPPFQGVGSTSWTYLRGKWTVLPEDVFDPATCALRTAATNIITTQELSRRTGLYILDKTGKNNTLAVLTSSTFDQVNFMVQMPGNNPLLNPTSYPDPNNATATAAYGTAAWWEFQLLTATPGGVPMVCNDGTARTVTATDGGVCTHDPRVAVLGCDAQAHLTLTRARRIVCRHGNLPQRQDSCCRRPVLLPAQQHQPRRLHHRLQRQPALPALQGRPHHRAVLVLFAHPHRRCERHHLPAVAHPGAAPR
jgi:hypothetical protein